MRKSSLHDFLLGLLNMQREMGLDSENSFVIEKVPFCHSATSSFFGVSDYLIKTVVREHCAGQTRFYHKNKGNYYHSEKRDRAISFIKNFSKIHCENLPDREIRRLPSYMNIVTIYTSYTENVAPALQLKARSFSHIFQTVFGDVYREPLGQPRITFLPRHSHPICNECDKISYMCKNAKTESERNYSEKRKRAHMQEIRQKYLECCDRKELALRFPEDYLHLSFDDIDQSKIKSPYNLQNTKECSGLLKLNNHCTGMLIHNGKFVNDRVVMAYLNNNQYPQVVLNLVSYSDVLIFSLQSNH